MIACNENKGCAVTAVVFSHRQNAGFSHDGA